MSRLPKSPTLPWDPTWFTWKTPSQPYIDTKSSTKSHARVVIRLTLDKQAAFSEQGSKHIEALSGDTIQTRVLHYIAWPRATPSTGRTSVSLDVPTPKGHVKRLKHYIAWIFLSWRSLLPQNILLQMPHNHIQVNNARTQSASLQVDRWPRLYNQLRLPTDLSVESLTERTPSAPNKGLV